MTTIIPETDDYKAPNVNKIINQVAPLPTPRIIEAKSVPIPKPPPLKPKTKPKTKPVTKLNAIDENKEIIDETKIVSHYITKYCRNEEYYFNTSNNNVFRRKNEIIDFYGFLNQQRTDIKPAIVNKKDFSYTEHDINALIKSNKATVLWFVRNGTINFHSQLMFQSLSKSYNVIVTGSKLWNIAIDNVVYMNCEEYKNTFIITQLKRSIAAVYFEDFTFFLYFSKSNFPSAKFSYLHYFDTVPKKWNNNILTDNGMHLIKNMSPNVDNLFFYNNDDLRRFKNQWGTKTPFPDTKIKMIPYVVNQVEVVGNNDQARQKQIVCYDKDIVAIGELWCEFRQNGYDLILFTEDSQTTHNTINDIIEQKFNPNSNKIKILPEAEDSSAHIVECVDVKEKQTISPTTTTTQEKYGKLFTMPRNEKNLIRCLNKSHIYVVTEIEATTHFIIKLAASCGNLCFIPKFFSELEGKKNHVLFDDINDLLKKKNNLKNI